MDGLFAVRPALNLNRLAYFAAVVDAGSFTTAAARLGMTKSVVSQQVARLETELRTALLVRTTRRLRVTEAGAALYDRCTVILKEAEAAFDDAAEAASQPMGTLRVTAPFDYGTSVVVPAVTAFTARHPACRVDLILTDARLDLVARGIDVAVRSGFLPDSSLQARRIRAFHQIVVCTPEVRDCVGAVRRPSDLEGRPFVANAALPDPLRWAFVGADGERETVEVEASVVIDATAAVHAAVLHGGGVSILPDFLVDADVRAGRLVRLLADWSLPAAGIHAVFPAARRRPPKVAAFVDMLLAVDAGRGGRSGLSGPTIV